MSPEQSSRTELKQAVSNARDRRFADIIALAVGLAAETHPQEIRKALGSVFSLEAVEETTGRMMLTLAECQRIATEARELCQAVVLDIERLEKRLDAVNYALELAERKLQPRRA